MRVRDLDGPREVLCFRRKVILVDPGQSPAERRSSLAHAIAHIDLGHRDCEPGSRTERREEIEADMMAARRLIKVDHLIDALVWSRSAAESAEELNVDADMVRVRGKHLHPMERDAVTAALNARGDFA